MKSSETTISGVSSDKYGAKLTHDPEFRGPVKTRSCTDIICLFLFISFIAGWLVVAIFAVREGDPRMLVYPTDSQGNICGVGALKNKPVLFFFDLLKCATTKVLVTGCPTPQVCVSECPNESFSPHATGSNEVELKKKLICKYDVDKNKMDLKTLLEGERCAKLYLKSTAMLGRCIPELFFKRDGGEFVTDEKNQTVSVGDEPLTTDSVKKAIGYLGKFLSFTEFGEKVFSDVKSAWPFMLLGLVISMLISLLWIVLMRWIAGVMIWLSIIIVLVFTAFACYYSSTMYVKLKNVPGSEERFKITLNFQSYLALRKTWLAFAIISGIIFGILFLVIIALRKRVYIAVALIKEASKAVGQMMSALFFPLLPYLLMLIFFAFWLTVALFIASSGKASFVVVDAPNGSEYKNGTTCNPKDFNSTKEGIQCLFKTYGLKDNIFTAHIYNLFGLFWGLFFAVGLGQVSLSGAFAAYYWTMDKSKNLPRFAVATGLYHCARYHLGSVAFGSLLIATVRVIRVMLEYADQQLKKYDNKFTQTLLWILKCCFWCLENLLKFISKNAYIMIAIYGENFCSSARHAFMLLMRNILRVVVLDKITDFVLFMGKLVVVAFSAVASYHIFASGQMYKGVPLLNYNLLPPIIITLGSYIIASGFFSVYGMAVDTLFLCFLEDCERNDGSAEKPYYMSKELMKILQKKNKFREPTPPASP